MKFVENSKEFLEVLKNKTKQTQNKSFKKRRDKSGHNKTHINKFGEGQHKTKIKLNFKKSEY